MMDFWINGTAASEKGIFTEDITPPVRPSKRVNLEKVPGRSGFVTTGDESYNEYVRYATCFIEDDTRLAEVWEYLDGARNVRFSNDETQLLECVSVDQIDPEAFTIDSCSFTVAFTCQPYRYLYPERSVNVTTSGSAVVNAGRLASEPVIRVMGTGSMQVVINGEPIDIAGGEVIIDSARMDCYDASGIICNERVTLYSGEFPKLSPGANVISWSGGCTGVSVQLKERDQ